MKSEEIMVEMAEDAVALAGVAERPLTIADIRHLPRLSALVMALITALGGKTAVHVTLRGSTLVLTPIPMDETETSDAVHARIAGVFDDFRTAAAAIKQNQTNPAGAQPLRDLASAATLAVLKTAACCVGSHRRVTYDGGNTVWTLPALQPGDLTDLEQPEPKRKLVCERITGLRRNTSTNLAGMILGDNLFVESTWPWRNYGHALEAPHFVEGTITSIDQGRWVLSPDAKLIQMPELPGLDARTISPNVAPKPIAKAKKVPRSPAPRRSGGRPQSRNRPKRKS